MRTFSLNDLPSFSAICQDENVMRYIGNGVHDEKIAKEKINYFIAEHKKNGYGLMALCLKENKRFIGFCGLINQVVDDEPFVELGYRLAFDCWKKGYATEAAIACKNHAFNKLALPQLISIIRHQNEASKNVAKKVGMQHFKRTTFHQVLVDVFAIKANSHF